MTVFIFGSTSSWTMKFDNEALKLVYDLCVRFFSSSGGAWEHDLNMALYRKKNSERRSFESFFLNAHSVLSFPLMFKPGEEWMEELEKVRLHLWVQRSFLILEHLDWRSTWYVERGATYTVLNTNTMLYRCIIVRDKNPLVDWYDVKNSR